MNWQHLTLILWLRWRLSYNQWRRAGKLNAVLTLGLAIFALFSAVMAFFLALIVGSLMLSKAAPDHMMIMWDLIICSFLFLWSMGVVTELQRSEFLSPEKLLHYPISPTGAFLLNYLSSLVSLAIVLFLPAMLGLCIASVVTHGPAMLLLFPLVIGFVLCVTALTYQFRGWMATLMQDKRRRRTIITVMTAVFILMTQIPNLAHLAFRQHRSAAKKTDNAKRTELTRKLAHGEITPVDHSQQLQELEAQITLDKAEKKARRFDSVIENVAMVNVILPVGWLPYGARAATGGHVLPGLLGSCGLILIGAASLWRSHRATMRFYTGQINSARPRRGAKKKDSPRIVAAPFLERTVAGCSEQVSVVVFAGLRNMLRAPDAKMALISPIILCAIFGSVLFVGPGRTMPVEGRPFLGIGAIAITMFGIMQLMLNVFGNDRGGFRAFVLMPIPRRDILLGKNLSLLPFVLLLAIALIVTLQIVMPQKLMHFAASLIQLVPAYLLVCLVGNLTSIFVPMAVSSGSLKPAQPKFGHMMVQMLAMMSMPMVLVPAVAALAVELLLDKFAGGRWFPLYLLLSLVELPIAVFLYRFLLTKQGALLQSREAKILEVVTGNLE